MALSIALAAWLAGSLAAALAGCSTVDDRPGVGGLGEVAPRSAALDTDPVTGQDEVPIPPGRYGAAFDIARDVLLDAHFQLDRVDARLGVITTHAKSTAGLATPWDREQSTLGQEWSDLLNLHERRARVVFLPAQPRPGVTDPGSVANPESDQTDLRATPQGLIAIVEVVVHRVHRPLWRVDSTGVGLGSFSTDPSLVAAGMQPSYAVPLELDRALAERLAGRIRERLSGR